MNSRENDIINNSKYQLIEAESKFAFSQKASVFECGDNYYSVIWETNLKGTGYVTYNYNGKNYLVNDQRGGNIRTTDTIHSVRIPKKHLDGNTYTYHSQFIVMKFAYEAIKGKTISSSQIKFRGYNNSKKINVLVLSDIHGNHNPCDNAMSNFSENYDLLILNGDISSNIVFKEDFSEKILNYAYRYSKGEIPVAYTRGNHETRGEFASEVPGYFGTKSGGLYFSFNYGPIYAVVLDTGEDKPDSNVEYSGLVDYQAYINEESEWLATLNKDENPTTLYRIAFAHQPYVDDRYGNNWVNDIIRLGISMVISGHTHTFDLNPAGAEGFPFKLILEGGMDNKHEFIATMLTFENKDTIHIKAYGSDKVLIADDDINI